MLVMVAQSFVMKVPLKSSGSRPDSLLEDLKNLAVLQGLQLEYLEPLAIFVDMGIFFLSMLFTRSTKLLFLLP